MEISSEILESLQFAGDSAHIPDKCFPALVRKVCECALNNRSRNAIAGDGQFSAIDQAILKETSSALLAIIVEAAKHDASISTIGGVLEDCKFSTDRVNSFNSIYSEIKPQMQILLSSVGNNSPHVVDVDWRLDYYIKNNHVERICQPTYLINLKTEECGAPGTKDVQFECTAEQLQDLVGKLKDASKCMEKLSQT
ncbi:COMM domain-containing protein 3-like [Lineus longissimus]|uniref:COMM domain-containing protein 3-like n=1 Tax=Lineus longissimus TaxID=88925 RepID=UPI002B4F290A